MARLSHTARGEWERVGTDALRLAGYWAAQFSRCRRYAPLRQQSAGPLGYLSSEVAEQAADGLTVAVERYARWRTTHDPAGQAERYIHAVIRDAVRSVCHSRRRTAARHPEPQATTEQLDGLLWGQRVPVRDDADDRLWRVAEALPPRLAATAIALSRSSSLRDAARLLGCSLSTVQRHVQELHRHPVILDLRLAVVLEAVCR